MLGGRMLYNDPSTITYVADISAMHQLYVYIYIHYIHARIINKAERMVRPLLRRRGRVAEPRARSSVTPICRIMPRTTCNCYMNKYIPTYLYNGCNCLSFAAWNCAACAPGSMPCTCVLEAAGVCRVGMPVRALPEIDVPGTACLIQALTFY